MRKLSVVLAAVALFAVLAAAQQQASDYYVDVYIVKVKPEKRAQFDTLVRQVVEANSKNDGDVWLASETTYGEQNTIYFSSRRASFDAVEKATAAFESALNKALGAENTKHWMQDWNDCLLSARAEMWRHRSDLSLGPTDPAEQAKLLGESRWLRTMAIQVRPGKTPEFEQVVRTANDALRKADPHYVSMIRQSVVGTSGTVFYITTPTSSFAAFDTMAEMPSFKELMGAQNYQKWNAMVAETVMSSETRIARLMPKYSNPPQEIIAAAPDFWQPATAEARR